MKSENTQRRKLLYILLAFLIADIVLAAYFRFHVLPEKEIWSFVESWKDGNIEVLLGVQSNPVIISEEDKEFEEKLLAEYGDLLSENETIQEEEDPLLNAIMQKTSLAVKTPLFIHYPCKVNVSVNGPDMVQVFKEMDNEQYEDGNQILDDVLSVLQNNNYKETESIVEIEIDQKDDQFYLKNPSPEMVDALYGGIVSLYAEEEERIYEAFIKQYEETE